MQFVESRIRKAKTLRHIHRHAAAARAATFVGSADDYGLPLPKMLVNVQVTVMHKLIHRTASEPRR